MPGPLAPTGGTSTLTGASVNIPNIGNIGASTVSVNGAGLVSQSQSGVNGININLLSGTVTLGATAIASTANCNCPTTSCSGSSSVTGLTLNGVSITVLGTPNQVVDVFVAGVKVGELIINEQVASVGAITVNALRLKVDLVGLGKVDLAVSNSHADIFCGAAPASSRFRGRGTGLLVYQGLLGSRIGTLASDTGWLPTTGGSLATSTTGAGIPGLLTTGVVTGNSSGGLAAGTPQSTQSSASVADLSVTALTAVTVTADAVQANTQCSCSAIGVPSCTGGSTLANLRATALGIPVTIPVNPAENTIIDVGVLRLGLNERQSGSNWMNRTALSISLNVPGLAETDIRVAESRSAIFCGLAPTAANVSLAGRVTDDNGDPIGRVSIDVSDGAGVKRSAVTNAFGYYLVDELPAGRTYIVEASHKRYAFAPGAVALNDNVTDHNITPISSLSGSDGR